MAVERITTKIRAIETLEARGPSNLEIKITKKVRNKGEKINQGVIIPLLIVNMSRDILKSTLLVRELSYKLLDNFAR